MNKITAVIPVRITDHVFEARRRLERILGTVPASRFNVLIVDYGTPASHQAQFDGLAGGHVRIVRHDVDGGTFSIGHARDLGVQYADDDVVMFHDIDFYGSASMYEAIHEEVTARDMHVQAYEFFCVPVFFLTEQGSSAALEMIESGQTADARLHRHLFNGTPGMVEFPAYGSSAIVVNKRHYLGIGGHSREFFGHGAEDYDVLHRLAAHCPKGPRTADYLRDTKTNDVAEYRGFRAHFALYGLDVFARGIFFVHLWHPKRTIPGYHQSNRNFSLLTDLMVRFDKQREQPLPLADLRSGRRALVLMNPASSSFQAIRHAVPQLGDYVVMPETDFTSADEVVAFVRRHSFDTVLLLNPYGNDHRLSIYRALREAALPYMVFDRGALPDSWFFDDHGFNYDSETYRAQRWDRELEPQVQARVQAYLEELRHGSDALEENGMRKSARYWREKLGAVGRKVLFVPFQRPSDTVTNHFAGAVGSVAGFQEWVRLLAARLPRSEWVVVCKNHPLDADLPPIEGVTYVGQEAHIHDMLELADKVLLMNSGVGVLAMAFDTPVICTAQAFYQHEGLCFAASSADEAFDLVGLELALDRQKVQRFYAHLLETVYSFGTTTYRKAVAADGSARNIANSILFRSLRMPGRPVANFGVQPQGVSLDAPLFATFGGRAGIKGALSPVKPAAAAKKANSAAAITSTTIAPMQQDKPAAKRRLPPLQRKLNKLVRNPRLFVTDFLLKRKLTQRAH